MKSRKREEVFFKALMMASLTLVFLALTGIVAVIAAKGLSSLNLAMILETPKGGYYLGKEGGIANAIIGSLYLVAGATVLSLLISLPVALALQK
ncbi:MAG: hypothetical protein KA113_16130, partial [Syntrophaceae bacterium]|nr:hypothetical protein [Syntrophaceae bacterium]